jgi:hypothetical protein
MSRIPIHGRAPGKEIRKVRFNNNGEEGIPIERE